MEEHKVIKVTHRWLIGITLVLILIMIGLVRYIIYKNTIFNKKFVYNTETTYKQEENNNNKAQNINIKSYTANVSIQSEKEKVYKIGDSFFIKVKIKSINDNIVNYSFSINDSEYYHFDTININDGNKSFVITVYKIGNYYVFENTGKADLSDTHIYIFNKFGNLYKDLYRIGDKDDSELFIESIDFTENELIINTSRIIDDSKILYRGNEYNISYDDSNLISKDIPLKIQYRYVVDGSGNVDFSNPEKNILSTFEDFIKINN